MDFKVKETRVLNQEEKAYAKKIGVSERFMSLLLSRNLKLDEIYDYLHPSINKLSDPLDILNMDKARDRLLKAIKNKERILIYGDYDCDGICATSILALFLRDKTDVQFYIPKREDGYGITKDAIIDLLSRKKFDLMISVDCGITAVEEVEFIKSQGVDVIITDHHEPQEKIPNCIVVDPKIEKKGFYEFCGAGVALRLVEACSNRQEIDKYIDICALATIADVVPLLKDNRIIVSIGLNNFKKNPRQGIKMLLGQDEMSSQNVMFKLAPRINAAGRMDTAMKVVDLFLESDYFIVKALTEDLLRDNQERQELCDIVVKEALDMLKGIDFNKTRLITLYKENWEHGVLGIAAARIVEEFKRPTILLAKNGEDLKGSSRSTKEVNIFELLSNHKELLTSFGGHAQAAGVGVKYENYETLNRVCNEDLLVSHSVKDFIPKVECDMELPIDMDFLSFTKELELMEPTGHENVKPIFLISANNIKFERISNSQHVKYKNNDLELIGFTKYYESLMGKTGNIQFEVKLDMKEFQNRYYSQGQIQSVNVKTLSLSQDDADCINLHHYNYSNAYGAPSIERIDENRIKEILKEEFGTLFVCFSQEEYVKLINRIPSLKNLPVSIAQNKYLNPENSIIVCPGEEFKYFQYNNVIICGEAFTYGYYQHILDNAINTYTLDDLSIKKIDLPDDTIRQIYKSIVEVQEKDRKIKVGSRNQLYKYAISRYKVSEAQFYLSLKILDELHLISLTERGVLNTSKQKSNLQQSFVYKNLNQLV